MQAHNFIFWLLTVISVPSLANVVWLVTIATMATLRLTRSAYTLAGTKKYLAKYDTRRLTQIAHIGWNKEVLG